MALDKKNKPITIEYRFTFPNQGTKIFLLSLDPKTLNLLHAKKEEDYPEWTKMGYEQCSNCCCDKTHSHCPVAINIYELVSSFKDFVSFSEVNVHVITQEREYKKTVSLQKGIASLLGIYMATSDCPIMAKLKHMVRFHLPLASPLESLSRILSTYLLAQYFRQKKGLEPDWALKNLKEIYENIRILNRAIKKRLKKVGEGDANVNALVGLDVFALTTAGFLDDDSFDKLGPLFEAYY